MGLCGWKAERQQDVEALRVAASPQYDSGKLRTLGNDRVVRFLWTVPALCRSPDGPLTSVPIRSDRP
jgi:hypothetical protein